jgi:hypothetical protein
MVTIGGSPKAKPKVEWWQVALVITLAPAFLVSAGGGSSFRRPATVQSTRSRLSSISSHADLSVLVAVQGF